MKKKTLKQLIRPRLSKETSPLAKPSRKYLLSAAGLEFPSCRSSLTDIHVIIQLYGSLERTAKPTHA